METPRLRDEYEASLRSERALLPLGALALALSTLACSSDVYLGGTGDDPAPDAGGPAAIVAGTYRLRYLAQVGLVCTDGLAEAQPVLAEQPATELTLIDGVIELGTPSDLIVIGGEPIARTFGPTTLVLARGADGWPGEFFAANLPVAGHAPGGTVRRSASFAIDPALATASDIGGRASVRVATAFGSDVDAEYCTATYGLTLEPTP